MREGVIVGLANHSLLISKSGKEFPIADSGAPILNEKEDITGVVLIFRDQTQERNARKVLQESERKFRDTVKYLDEGYYSVTPDGLLLDHNHAFKRILGFDMSKDMKGVKLPDFWQNPEDRKVYLEELKTKGFIRNFQINAKKLNGEKVVVMANSHMLRDEEGRLVRIEGTFTDFTRLKLIEEALKDSESKYRSLFENAQVGMYRSKLDGSALLAVNQKLCEIFGYCEEEMLGNPATIRWADPLARNRMVSDLRQFGLLHDHSIDIVTKSGEIRTCSVSIQLNADKAYIEGSVFDITERKQAEEALKISKERLLFATEGSNLGIWNWNIVTGELIWSDKCKALFGVPPDEIMSYQRFSDALHPDDRERTDKAVNDALDNHKDYDIEYRSLWPDGSIHWLAAIGRGYYDSTGKAMRLEGVVLDIAERKRAEEEIRKLNAELEDRVATRTSQLEASNKELEAFSYSVSHDLRAPLRHVSGYVELLNKHFHSELSGKGQHYVNSISDSVRLMGKLIDDLLRFSRTGRIEMVRAELDMNEILKEVKESICKENPERKIEWNIGKLPLINGDYAMLQLVWLNLLNNAVKFTGKKDNARIEIGVSEEKKEWIFFVRDNGVGFDMQYAHKLFGVFQRLHTTEEYEGTGIGLANVRRIVFRHGGRTWAEAELDKGAIFNFSIPKNKEEL